MKLSSLLRFQIFFVLCCDSQIIQVQKGQVRSTLEWKSSKLRCKLREIDVKGKLWNQYLCWRAHHHTSKIKWRGYILIVHIFFFFYAAAHSITLRNIEVV